MVFMDHHKQFVIEIKDYLLIHFVTTDLDRQQFCHSRMNFESPWQLTTCHKALWLCGNVVQAISGYATLMSPNKNETAVCGSHCLDC